MSLLKGGRNAYPDYSHAQHDFDQEYPISGVISFAPPPTFYPQSSSRLRALFAFYFFAVIALLGFFLGYNLYNRRDGPLLFETDAPPAFGWHYVLFSQWVATLHLFFFLFAIADLCLRHSPSSERVHAFKDRLFAALFALTLFTAVAYWPTVFVPRLDSTHPTPRLFAEDLATHTIPALLLLVELLVASHRFPTHACHVLRDLIPPLLYYGAWVGFSFLAHARNHAWPLRFQHTHAGAPLMLAAVYGGGAVAIALFFLLGRAAARCLWPERPLSAEHDDDALFGFIDGAAAPAHGSRAPQGFIDVPYNAFPDAFGDSPVGSPPPAGPAAKRSGRY